MYSTWIQHETDNRTDNRTTTFRNTYPRLCLLKQIVLGHGKNCILSLLPLAQLGAGGDGGEVHVHLSDSKTELHRTRDRRLDFIL